MLNSVCIFFSIGVIALSSFSALHCGPDSQHSSDTSAGSAIPTIRGSQHPALLTRYHSMTWLALYTSQSQPHDDSDDHLRVHVITSHHFRLILVCSDDHHSLNHYHNIIITIITPWWWSHHTEAQCVSGPAWAVTGPGRGWAEAALPWLASADHPDYLVSQYYINIAPRPPHHTAHSSHSPVYLYFSILCIKRCVFTSGEGEAHGARWVCPAKCLAPATGDHGTIEGQTANMARHTVFAIRYLFNSVSESFQVKFPPL